MTQTVERKITYPKGRMVVVRDSTVAISCNHNSGATLLSVLLFWYDHPQKYDTYNDEEHTFTVCRTQAEIEEAACHQIDAKTIHDSAVPLLHLFGYLTVTEKMNGNLYTLHMDHIFAAYATYEQGAKALHDFLYTQLEISPIDIPPDQLEEVLIKKRKLSLQIEKTLIRLRENSYCKRGRKPKPQEALEEISEKDRILENFRESNTIDSLVASAHAESDGDISFLSQLDAFQEILQEVQNGQGPLDGTPRLEGEHTQEGLLKSAETSLSSGSAGTSTLQDSTSTSETLQEIPTQVALLPAVPVEPAKTPPTNKTVGKGKSKIPEPVPLCSSRTIREAIDAIRGYALEEVGAIIHQNNVLKEWCQKHTLEEYQCVIEHVTRGHCANKKHQFWREGTNLSSFFNADKLAELTPGILAELGHIPKPVAPPEVTPKEEKIIGWQPQRRITPPKGVTVTYA